MQMLLNIALQFAVIVKDYNNSRGHVAANFEETTMGPKLLCYPTKKNGFALGQGTTDDGQNMQSCENPYDAQKSRVSVVVNRRFPGYACRLSTLMCKKRE